MTSNGKLEKDYFLLISNSLPIKKTYKWLEEDTEEVEREQMEEKEEERKEEGEKEKENKKSKDES